MEEADCLQKFIFELFVPVSLRLQLGHGSQQLLPQLQDQPRGVQPKTKCQDEILFLKVLAKKQYCLFPKRHNRLN
jgi:hypothetical protein